MKEGIKDSQDRRRVDNAVQKTDLGASLMVDSQALLAVRPARAVRPLDASEKAPRLAIVVAQIDSAAVLATAVLKIQELVTAYAALFQKYNELAASLDASRSASEKKIAELLDALKSAKLMEK